MENEKDTIYIKVDLDTDEAEQKIAALTKHLEAASKLFSGKCCVASPLDTLQAAADKVLLAANQTVKEERLKALSAPLVRYLRENHHPHTAIIITDTRAVVVEDVLGIPFPD